MTNVISTTMTTTMITMTAIGYASAPRTWRRELHALLDVDREAVQDAVEDAAHLAGLDEVDEEVVEDLRVAPERVAEGGALLDGVLDVLERRLRRTLFGSWFAEDVEALHQRQAGVDHRGELADELDEVLRLDAACRR